nr:class I SAM-dependent methyltransferase [Gammaproteobacteria bacterium]
GGLATQAQFLLANGLLELAQEAMAGAGDAERITLAQQIKTLTLPGEMGEKFKVLALTKDIEVEFDLVAGIPLG